jgi:hypothetical protein
MDAGAGVGPMKTALVLALMLAGMALAGWIEGGMA